MKTEQKKAALTKIAKAGYVACLTGYVIMVACGIGQMIVKKG